MNDEIELDESALGPLDRDEFTDEEIDEMLEDLTIFENKARETFKKALEEYINESEIYKAEDWLDIYEEWFDENCYDDLYSIGYCTVKHHPKETDRFIIDQIEYKGTSIDVDLTDPDIRFDKQPFIERDNIDCLVHQRTVYEDSYYGYMLFPMKEPGKYWVVNYRM